MEVEALSTDSFGFSRSEIRLIISIIFESVTYEASETDSYSRVRRHFRSKEENVVEQDAYRLSKQQWIEQWRDVTCKLLEVDDLATGKSLSREMASLKISNEKAKAMLVEIATFEPYFKLSSVDETAGVVRFSDLDRSNYFQQCATLMNQALKSGHAAVKRDLVEANHSFNDCARRIGKSVSGANWTWAWIGLGTALLLITAPLLAGVVGGAMGLSGAAATSAGLAFLGGGSLAAGGLGMTGGYMALMAGGAILGYSAGSGEYRSRLRRSTKEELLVSCSKLYAVSKLLNSSCSSKLQICSRALSLEGDHEADADRLHIDGKTTEAEDSECKAKVLRAFRGILRAS